MVIFLISSNNLDTLSHIWLFSIATYKRRTASKWPQDSNAQKWKQKYRINKQRTAKAHLLQVWQRLDRYRYRFCLVKHFISQNICTMQYQINRFYLLTKSGNPQFNRGRRQHSEENRNLFYIASRRCFDHSSGL